MTPLSCPVCKAAVEQGPACRRCRADLSLLLNLEAKRSEILRRARQWIAAGKWDLALALAGRADSLRHDESTERLMAAMHLLRRDFSSALKLHRRLSEGIHSGR